jgi:acylglycerol lipase
MHQINYSEFELQSLDGTKLFTREWKPKTSIKAWITFCHGQSEHSGRYDYIARTLVEAGYALAISDLRGHGQSGGKRGHTDLFSRYVDDLRTTLNYTRKQIPNHLFLAGHSMGGLIAIYIALENPSDISGIILSSAALRFNFVPPTWKVFLGRLMAKIIPGLTMGNEVNVEDLSHDQNIVDHQRNDPYNHGVISARAFVEFVSAQEEVLKRADEIKLPLLIMHGEQDKLIAVSGSRELHAGVSSKEKQLSIYKDLYHEIFNELDRDKVINDVLFWLEARKASQRG